MNDQKIKSPYLSTQGELSNHLPVKNLKELLHFAEEINNSMRKIENQFKLLEAKSKLDKDVESIISKVRQSSNLKDLTSFFLAVIEKIEQKKLSPAVA